MSRILSQRLAKAPFAILPGVQQVARLKLYVRNCRGEVRKHAQNGRGRLQRFGAAGRPQHERRQFMNVFPRLHGPVMPLKHKWVETSHEFALGGIHAELD